MKGMILAAILALSATEMHEVSTSPCPQWFARESGQCFAQGKECICPDAYVCDGIWPANGRAKCHVVDRGGCVNDLHEALLNYLTEDTKFSEDMAAFLHALATKEDATEVSKKVWKGFDRKAVAGNKAWEVLKRCMPGEGT